MQEAKKHSTAMNDGALKIIIFLLTAICALVGLSWSDLGGDIEKVEASVSDLRECNYEHSLQIQKLELEVQVLEARLNSE